MKKNSDSKGIILIACGHPNYGVMAYQLALSIKCGTPDISITLLTTADEKGISHLDSSKRNIFDRIIHISQESMISKKTGRIDFFKIKTCIYDLSPYRVTLYLDADMLWLPARSVHVLFHELEQVNFTMSNRGSELLSKAHENFIHWAKPKDIIEAYPELPDAPLFNLSSELIYFKKDKEVKKMFAQAKKNFDAPRVRYVLFGNNQPDELPFCIAMMQTGVYPHSSPFIPNYWYPFHKRTIPLSTAIHQNFYAISVGGAVQEDNIKIFYDNLAQYYCNQIGVARIRLQSKKDYLSERFLI